MYELSSRGPLFEYFREKSKKLTHSEFFPGTAPGDYRNGVQCQDVQNLTYQDGCFDICTSTEVFEHVPNDTQGFSEICRVLKPSGVFVFTVPLAIDDKTVKRAELSSAGVINHLLPPEYHNDPTHSYEPVLAFRNYGYDVLDRLLIAGFKSAALRNPGRDMAWG